jgi:1,2-phenylacetyl-CoA epoxidase PaaB subunit
MSKAKIHDPTNSDHVKQQSPFQLKKRELTSENLDMESLPTLKAPNPDQGINVARQTWTRKQRGQKGNSAKAI